MRFTDRQIQGLKPGDERYEILEDSGLRVRVTPAGRKSWVYIYKKSGQKRRLTLGHYPELSLSEARAAQSDARSLQLRGEDPATDKQKVIQKNREAHTVRVLIDEFLSRYVNRYCGQRHADETARILNKELDCWAVRKVKDIARRDIVTLLDRIVDRGAPVSANRTLKRLNTMFNFAVDRGIIEMNPCYRMKAPSREKSRERVLDADEIKKIWNTLPKTSMHSLLQLMYKLILVTAARSGEVRLAEVDEFDLQANIWHIPPAHTKNNLPLDLPLSDLAVELVKEALTFADGGVYLFPSTRKENAPFTERVLNDALRKNADSFSDMERWTPHDLRRTVASHITASGVSRLVVKKILNHSESNDVTAVYDRHSYMPEKREALESWCKNLLIMINQKGASDE